MSTPLECTKVNGPLADRYIKGPDTSKDYYTRIFLRGKSPSKVAYVLLCLMHFIPLTVVRLIDGWGAFNSRYHLQWVHLQEGYSMQDMLEPR
jgi:hypothetical protein